MLSEMRQLGSVTKKQTIVSHFIEEALQQFNMLLAICDQLAFVY